MPADPAPGSAGATLSLVIPAHNEALNMEPVLGAVRRVLPQLAAGWEVVLVDDGSTDGTAATARRVMGDEAAHLTVVTHAHKSGYGISVADGLRAARGDWVGFMDGDGQFDVTDLAKLVALLPQADLVAGWRLRRADPWHRSVVSGTFNVFVKALYGIRYRDVDCGMKLMRREVLEAAAPLLARAALLNTELYFKAERSGFRIAQTAIPHHPRLAGRRSGGRLVPILRAVRELVRLRLAIARTWRPPDRPPTAAGG